MLRIAIVGGGPTGIYALAALLRANVSLHVEIFEASDAPGWGTPYDPTVNHAGLLANIASFELPPVCETLVSWLLGLPVSERTKLGVGEVDERAFFPRVALGAYFGAQCRRLAAEAPAGARVELHTAARVEDVRCAPGEVRVAFKRGQGEYQTRVFDYAIVATGHRSRAPRNGEAAALPAYPLVDAAPEKPLRVGVLGASLTAIDAALTLAFSRGSFTRGADGLSWRRDPRTGPLWIELMSRRGVLPEADFFFPYPYAPLRFCSADALLALKAAPDPLDRAFDLFRQELQAEDPDFAARIGLADLSADDFAARYFAERGEGDPFAAARRNLEEAQASAERRRTSPWRYVVLRAHEAFGALAPFFSAAERERFRRGLQRVFVDNYAAVPPVSIERLLALRAAGALELRRIASDYIINASTGGGAIVSEGGRRRAYDLLVDARGEASASAAELPFPSLRLQILANQMADGGGAEDALAVDDDFQLLEGLNPVERVYCLASPFLLHRHPFVQGLTSAKAIADKAVRRLLADADRPRDDAGVVAEAMAAGALYLGGGLVVATPAHMS